QRNGRIDATVLHRHGEARSSARGCIAPGAGKLVQRQALVGALLLGRIHPARRLEMTFVREPVTESGSPADLVRRILAGERSAEDELVCRYSRGVSIIVRRIARDPALTEDICQEAFRLVLEKVRRGEVREAERLSGFICNLARNLAIDHFRQAARRETAE